MNPAKQGVQVSKLLRSVFTVSSHPARARRQPEDAQGTSRTDGSGPATVQQQEPSARSACRCFVFRPFAQMQLIHRAKATVSVASGWQSGRFAANATAACFAGFAAAASTASAAEAHEGPEMGISGSDKKTFREGVSASIVAGAKEVMPRSMTIRELEIGSGALAETGMWARVHYVVRLVGDNSVVEATRTSGYGDRDYGAPVTFEIGNLADPTALRALHSAVLDMRVGGRRRLRTAVGEPDFGYRNAPPCTQRDAHDRRVPRNLQRDWLMDVEVELVAVSSEPPPTPLHMWLRSLAPAPVADLLFGRDP